MGPPVVSGKKLMDAFIKLGWEYDRRESSHMIMVKDGEPNTLSIPDDREVSPGVIRRLCRAARLTLEDVREALRKK